MMSDRQKEPLAVLADIWALSPDVRLGQLFAHLGFLGEVHLGRSLGYIDDDELLSILYRHRAELLARLETPSTQALPPTGNAIPVSDTSKVAAAAPAVER
jgi:hypothetical protein